MSDFSHLQALEVTEDDSPHEFELYEIDTAPVLYVRCTQSYAPYENRIRARRSEIERKHRKAKKGKGRKRANDALLDLMRSPDREAYPGTIVYGWKTNKDANGIEVEYSEDTCRQFLNALPDWLFDRIRLYCMEPQNFVDTGEPDEEEEEELAGN